jgi:hypothetical protein
MSVLKSMSCWAVAGAILLGSAHLTAAEKQLTVVVQPTASVERHVPIQVEITVPEGFEDAAVTVRSADGTIEVPGQITGPCLRCVAEENASTEGHELAFVLPETPTERPLTLTATLSTDKKPSGKVFAWKETETGITDLVLGDKPVLRYMHLPLDESSDATREKTYKVFHHVFDPEGNEIITKGPGGKFTHHRGIFYGFSKVSYNDGKTKCDIWHCRGANQQHVETVSQEAGPVLGSHVVKISWNGPDGKPFAYEYRELTAFNTDGGVLFNFTSQLVPVEGKVNVDGDPQHAGFHFRASNEVHDVTKGQTYYLRPDGQDAPGKTRNWPGQKQHVDLPWNAMSFVVGDQRYTTVYMDSAENPKEARFSERDYGRFGSYFVSEATPEKPLVVNYRLWVQRGELNGEDAAALDRGFDNPPEVTVK